MFASCFFRFGAASRVASCLYFALFSGAFVTHALGQQYKTIPPRLNNRAAKQLSLTVSEALRNPQNFQQDKDKVDTYFTRYYFPKMTSTSAADLGRLGKMREDLFKRYLRAAQVKPAQEHLTNMTLKVMRSIARGNYHPAVRYNAVLILGSLDQQYAPTPIPLPAGTNELLELLEQEDFKGVKVPASIRLGALVGLERHTRFGVDARYADRVTKAVLQVIALEQPPTDLTLDVHHWMQCRAAHVLANQYAKGPTPEMHAALTAMIADVDMGLEDRCCVAELLGKIEYSKAKGIDGAATVVALGGLTKDVVSDEAKHARDHKKEVLRGSPATRLGGFRGQGVGGTEPTYARARLLSRLKSITDGADSLQAGLPDASKEQLQSLTTALAPVMQVAADKDSFDLDIVEQVLRLTSEIENVVNGWQQPAEATDEPADKDLS